MEEKEAHYKVGRAEVMILNCLAGLGLNLFFMSVIPQFFKLGALNTVLLTFGLAVNITEIRKLKKKYNITFKL